jgi:hypothetical protein
VTVWIRLFATVQTDGCEDGALTLEVTPKISIVVHKTEKSARAAAAKYGGIVLAVEASSLKGQSEHDDIGLTDADSNDVSTTEEGLADTTAYMTVSCEDVPYETVYQSLTTGKERKTPPKRGQYQSLMHFTPEGEAYLDELEKELGAGLHQ